MRLRSVASSRDGFGAGRYPAWNAQPSSTTELLVGLAATLIFPKDFFISVLELHTEIIGIAILAVLAIHTAIASSAVKLSTAVVTVGAALSFAWLGSVLSNGALNTSSYYASFVVALLIGVIRPRRFLDVMLFLMIVNTGLQLFEALSGEFIFTYQDEDYDYDEAMLSTSDGGLRVKGLFGSPLTPISILMSLAFLRPRSSLVWLVLCLASALGQGRLGLAIGSLGLVLSLASGGQASRVGIRARNFAFAFLGLVCVVGTVMFFGTEGSIQRMLEAGSADNSQNISRLEFWATSIIAIGNFDYIEHLFGRFGFIKALQGGTESDWLRIWLDNGLICVLAYAVPLLWGIVRSVRAGMWLEMYSFLGTTVVMAVYPHAQSMPNGTLVWMLLLGSRGAIPGISHHRRSAQGPL